MDDLSEAYDSAVLQIVRDWNNERNDTFGVMWSVLLFICSRPIKIVMGACADGRAVQATWCIRRSRIMAYRSALACRLFPPFRSNSSASRSGTMEPLDPWPSKLSPFIQYMHILPWEMLILEW